MIKLGSYILRVSGGDAQKFLQGLVSNDIGLLNKGSNAIHAYLLTPQGKFMFEFLIAKDAESYLLITQTQHFDLLQKKLKMYKLRSEVTIKNESDNLNHYTDLGNGALNNVGISFQDPRAENFCQHLITDKELKATEDINAYTQARIDNLIPEGDRDLQFEGNYPMQFRMVETNSVCFKKGCYVGQEVTARTHHRGKVRKTIFKVKGQQNLDGKRGEEILFDDKKAGIMLSTQGNNALALLEIETVEAAKAAKKPLFCDIIDVEVLP